MKTVRIIICLVMMNFAMCFCCRAGIFDNTLHVYKYGPATFAVNDYDSPWDLDGFAMRLKNKQWASGHRDLVSSFLYDQLDESARQSLNRYAILRANIKDSFSDSGRRELNAIAKTTDIEAILVTNLNRIIQGPLLYEKERFQDVERWPQTKKLLKQNPKGEDLIRLNWSLLKDVCLVFSRGAIAANGEITGTFKRRESINHIEIFLRKLSDAELKDIWVAFSPTNWIALAEITEDKIKPYAANRYSFQFDGKKLVRFGADYNEYIKPKSQETVSLGSLKNKSALVLPCSVEDFEKVFGKADEIDRTTAW
jgi:hypothetical protein